MEGIRISSSILVRTVLSRYVITSTLVTRLQISNSDLSLKFISERNRGINSLEGIRSSTLADKITASDRKTEICYNERLKSCMFFLMRLFI